MVRVCSVLSKAAAAVAVALLIVANMASPALAQNPTPTATGTNMIGCQSGSYCGAGAPAGTVLVKCGGFCFIGNCGCFSTPGTPTIVEQCGC